MSNQDQSGQVTQRDHDMVDAGWVIECDRCKVQAYFMGTKDGAHRHFLAAGWRNSSMHDARLCPPCAPSAAKGDQSR